MEMKVFTCSSTRRHQVEKGNSTRLGVMYLVKKTIINIIIAVDIPQAVSRI